MSSSKSICLTVPSNKKRVKEMESLPQFKFVNPFIFATWYLKCRLLDNWLILTKIYKLFMNYYHGIFLIIKLLRSESKNIQEIIRLVMRPSFAQWMILKYFYVSLNKQMINILFFIIFWLKEVRSKILILLETTGGILFSLEGFQKMPFTIKNFTQADLHSTREIPMAFLGGYNSTGGIQISFLGVYDCTRGIQI